MLFRYGIDAATGRQKKVATLYTADEHRINPQLIAKEVVFICRRLKEAGYEGYLVGGAVRDLLLNHPPHDFDIATNAEPNRIKRLFKNCRIIGRRFKLCHIFYPGNLIFEVSTFRSATADNFINDFGTIEEDAHRRDFSVNALYYCPLTQRLFDYVGGVNDIKNKKIRSIIDLNLSFKQDPVRMIRAVKYSVLTGFSMEADIKTAIRRDASFLSHISVSRMVEELFKILQSGHSAAIVKKLMDFRLFPLILPEIHQRLLAAPKCQPLFFAQLKDLDHRLSEIRRLHPQQEIRKDLSIWKLSEVFMDPVESLPTDGEAAYALFKTLFFQMKALLKPLTPPNYEIEGAIDLYLNAHHLPKRTGSYQQLKEEARQDRKQAASAVTGAEAPVASPRCSAQRGASPSAPVRSAATTGKRPRRRSRQPIRVPERVAESPE